MYSAEVLGKFAVIQHFIYSYFLPAKAVKSMESLLSSIPLSSVQAEPCCSDSVHFPSAAAARK
jgi:hypothetical protein